MSNKATVGIERAGFGTLLAALVSPVVAHGIWLPLVHLIGPAGQATQVTAGALLVCLSTAVAGIPGRFGLPARVTAGVAAAVCVSLACPLGPAGFLTLLLVAFCNALLWRSVLPRLPATLDGTIAQHKVLTTLYVLVALVCVVSVARVSTFIGDASRVDLQALPGERFTETHSCLTAYVRASDLQRSGVENLYHDSWWLGSHGLPARPTNIPNPFHPFDLDNFSYPPTFLLVMPILAPLRGDFLAQRALWFGISGGVVAVGFWIVAFWVRGQLSHRVLLLSPLVYGSAPVLLMLQIGTFHPTAVVLSVLAMVAFARGRAGGGGAMLALTILSKISPGILGILLLARRDFRSAGWAAGMGIVLLGASVLWFGTDPVQHFISYTLPRLSSGAAFPFMDTQAGITTNIAPFGIPFKLAVIGIEIGDPWRLGVVVSRVYTLGIVVVAVLSALRGGDRREQAIRWMALLVLAAMQSPFSPAYATIGILWATALLSVEVRRWYHALALITLWPALLFAPPGLELAHHAVLSICQTLLTIGVSVWLAARAPAPSVA